MAFSPGQKKPEGSGRKKGAKNKRTLVACELDGFAKNEGFPILREIFADDEHADRHPSSTSAST
jgi:hypothetical protein